MHQCIKFVDLQDSFPYLHLFRNLWYLLFRSSKMPYLGLKGNGLLAGIALSSGMGFVLFGKDYLLFLILEFCSTNRDTHFFVLS